MIKKNDLYTPELKRKVTRAFLDHRIITVEEELPKPRQVLYSESENSVTSYYVLTASDRPDRIIAAKSFPEGNGNAVWERIVQFQEKGSPVALLPIDDNLPDDEIIIYDDGKWALELFARIEAVPPGVFPELADVLTGRAGLSRIYCFRIPPSGIVPHPRTCLLKFDRPDRAAREWEAIGLLRHNAPPEVVLPDRRNTANDGILFYDYFGDLTSEIISLDQFLCRQYQNIPHVRTAVEKLHIFSRRLYSNPELMRSNDSWATHVGDIASSSLLIEGVLDVVGDRTEKWQIAATPRPLPNPDCSFSCKKMKPFETLWKMS